MKETRAGTYTNFHILDAFNYFADNFLHYSLVEIIGLSSYLTYFYKKKSAIKTNKNSSGGDINLLLEL